MRVTVHQRSGPQEGPYRHHDGTLESVVGLKIEIDDRTQQAEDRIEIALGGTFYRIEPRDHRLEISVVGVPVPEIVIRPQAPGAVQVSSVRQPTDSST